MPAVPALPELQRRFIAALYDEDDTGPIASVDGNGLDPVARLRIYRRSCNEIQTGALRTAYPAVLALVGDAFFDQTAHGYRRAYPSQAGNLQAFGAHFANYLEEVPEARSLPYLPDVARLEWLRQQAALALDAEPVSPDTRAPDATAVDGSVRITLHPSVRLLASRHAVLTIWRYALEPTPEPLQLPDQGERIALWREDDEVAMAALDAASFACIEALAHRYALAAAQHAAQAIDPGFDLQVCIDSFAAHGLIFACLLQGVHHNHPGQSACR